MIKPLRKKYGLVVQGGTLRSIFTSGVLDAFISSGFNPFKYIVGVSGGAMCMSYYISKQYKTTYNIMQELAGDEKFKNWLNMFSEEGFINLQYLDEFTRNKYPLDLKVLNRKSRSIKVEIVTTSLEDGRPIYLRARKKNWYKYLKASASIPFVTRGEVIINNLKLMDGGWSDPIPVKRAIQNKCTDIIVIRTLPKSHRETWSYFGKFGGFWHRNSPSLSERFHKDYVFYNEIADFLEKTHNGINIHQIAPKDYLKTTSYSTTNEFLDADYRLGMELGLDLVKELKSK